ncbi:enoyl-CoA hydratase-related protein [Gordonia phosphorivorans]|uniref:Enoyl-CoA hydratase-related protein n=1 Tax=Gordonia phosphorivorans TaxID=1056982 RepID=A0ABV6H9W6_9ACTN
MPDSPFDVSVQDSVATVTFTRPATRNRFTMQMCLELGAFFDRINADDEIRVVILTGSGSAFCAGADLSEGFIGATELTAEQEATVARVGEVDGVSRDPGGWLALKIARSLKPVIVAFNGDAVGIGVTMALPADIRIAAESARFGFVFARRGIVPEAASTWFLPRLVGIAQAVEWVMTGRIFDADEALRGGLVSAVVPDDQLLDKARALAAEIVANTSAISVAAARRMLWHGLELSSPWYAHADESHGMRTMAGTPDGQEGVLSFLEKRPARFPMSVADDLPGFVPDWPTRPDEL